MIEMITVEMIISAVVSGIIGYLLPQPKWVTVFQLIIGDKIKKLFN